MWKRKLKKILVVDDDPDDRVLINNMIDRNYNIIEASDGKEALDLVCNERPDLILLDIMMPKIDGYSVCSLIKKDPITSDIPVIMLTGVKEELNIRFADELGVNGYIAKPPNKQDLIDMIGQLLFDKEQICQQKYICSLLH